MREILPVLMQVTQQKQTRMEVSEISVPAGMALKLNLETAMQMALRTS